MEHVFWLIDGLLAGRPGPVQAPWDAASLRAGGLQVVLSLNTEADPEALAAAGLVHHALPMPPILPLTGRLQEVLLEGLEPVLARLREEVTAGRPVVIHCHAGKDRTGLAMASYLVRHEGMHIEAAIDRVRAVRPIAMSAPGYLDTARRFAAREARRARDEAGV
ncbi:MAG: dual specificity protein phosphatase family protein [Anaerolineae bacterium]|jgi:protein-tyrosine phosphatase